MDFTGCAGVREVDCAAWAYDWRLSRKRLEVERCSSTNRIRRSAIPSVDLLRASGLPARAPWKSPQYDRGRDADSESSPIRLETRREGPPFGFFVFLWFKADEPCPAR
jgi:hypothetical protein